MIWKKDKLKPSQPYFVFDTEDFYQETYLKQGISHFYTFRKGKHTKLRSVPDGCIDLVFEYYNGHMQGYACGTRRAYFVEDDHQESTIFGVRFMPGVQPELINVTMRQLLDVRIPLETILKYDVEWLKELEEETDFYQRIRIFLKYYTQIEKRRKPPFGKKEIVQSIKNLVYESDGKIKVCEMQERTGYSERYINKIFIEEMGFSPKVFCKIVQFQRALEFLNYGAPDKMTDAAVFLGYYDQSQFIRDFAKYAGITPKKYLKMVMEEDYKNKIHENK